MNQTAKLSIIIPVYNGAQHIEKTVHSVLHSSYQNLELLLIDDGSTDTSLIICRKLAQSDSRIKVYHKENGGIASARNYGLDHAVGSYIGFCDQDDTISGDMYQKMIERLISDQSQAAVCGCYSRKADGRKVVFEKYTDDLLDRQHILQKLLYPMLFRGFTYHANIEISISPSIWKCIITRQLIDDHQMRFRTFVNYEDDFIMLLQLFLHADSISTLSDILYYWNTNTESETHRSAKRYLKDLELRQHNLIDYVVRQLSDYGIPRKIVLKYIYAQQCRNALLQLDNLAAAKDHKTFRRMKEELCGCESIRYLQLVTRPLAPQKGFVRNTVLIPLLRRNHVFTAYYLNQMINTIRSFVEKYYITERFERGMKESKRHLSALH